MSADSLPLTISWFATAFPDGPAIGDPKCTTWRNFADVFWWRREGPKDGPSFVPARFSLETDGRHVRRLKRNLLARSAVALDCEISKSTGEVPPSFSDAVARICAIGWAAVIYTSHNHDPVAPRYRIVLPLSEEIAPELAAVEVVADRLSLAGVLDRSKIGASSLFYLPSAEPGLLHLHEEVVIDGAPIDAAWIRATAGAILADGEIGRERQAAVAHREAEARRQAKMAGGADPDASLIERIRPHLNLEQVLRAHRYDRSKGECPKFRHPNSSSGSYGANIQTFGGIERVFSHNSGDPLHANNLPDWCGDVTALDVVDVVTILDFRGNRTKALAELAKRFGLTKAEEQKRLAALIFRLIRRQATQEEIETAAYAEGERLGLARAEVQRVAAWVASQAITKAAV